MTLDLQFTSDEIYGWGMHRAIQGELSKLGSDFSSVISKNTTAVQNKAQKYVTVVQPLTS